MFPPFESFSPSNETEANKTFHQPFGCCAQTAVIVL